MLGGMSTSLFSQQALQGQIEDPEGNPLVGATIYLPELKRGTSSDEQGRFRLNDLPAGRHFLVVSYVGYASKTLEVNPAETPELSITLEEAHIEATEVVVTGLSRAHDRRRNPVPLSILRPEFFEHSRAESLAEGLARVPGISVLSTGPAIGKPVIRGLSHNRVIVVQDGLRQEGQQWGDEHGLEIDAQSVHRAEIFRGPASLLYGSDGIAGVISLESPPPVEEGHFRGGLSTAYHSNNRRREHGLFAALNNGTWNARLQGRLVDAQNFRNARDGVVFNSGFSQRSGQAAVGVQRPWGSSRLLLGTFNQKVFLPGGERDPTTGALLPEEGPFQKINHHRAVWQNQLLFEESALRFTIGAQQNRRREFEHGNTPELFFDLRSLHYDLKYFLSPADDWELTLGGNGMAQWSFNKAEEVLVPEYRLHDEGVFAFARKSLQRWEFSGGLRFDHRFVHGLEWRDEDDQPVFTDFRRNFQELSGSLGAAFLPDEHLSLKLNLSKGFRSPNIAELGSNGVHEGTFRYEVGNTDLQPERSYELDLSVLWNTPHLSLSVSPFLNIIDRFIFLEKLGAQAGGDSLILADGELLPVFRFTQNDARLWGGELSLDFHPHPLDWLHLEQRFSAVWAEQRNAPERFIPFIPPPRYDLELRLDLLRKHPRLRRFWLETDIEHHFAQNRALTANDFETPTPAYTLWNAALGVQFVNRRGQHVLSLLLAGRNLLDKAYQSHLSRLKYAPENPLTGERGISEMGRNFVMKLTVPLQFPLQAKTKPAKP